MCQSNSDESVAFCSHSSPQTSVLDGTVETRSSEVITPVLSLLICRAWILHCGHGWVGHSMTALQTQVQQTKSDGVTILLYCHHCLSSMSAKTYLLTYLDLDPTVHLGTSGDEKSPFLTVTGDPAGSMPADTHLFQVLFKVIRHGFFCIPIFLLPSSGTQCCMGGSAMNYFVSGDIRSHIIVPS